MVPKYGLWSRNGQIRNGGINQEAKIFNPKNGLSIEKP